MLNPEIHQIPGNIWVWHVYDPAAKTELFSSAILTAAGLYFVDPIAPPEEILTELGDDQIAGIIVTNSNHHRSALVCSDRFSVPIFAHRETFGGSRPSRFHELSDDAKITGSIEVIRIEGAAPGEIAIYHSSNGGTLIVGDALINFEPYGFTFLPRKYCDDEKEMRVSIRKLLERPAERLLFAHGTPILSGAIERLQQLVDQASR